MYSSLLFYLFPFPLYLSDLVVLCQLFIYFCNFALAFFSTHLHYVLSMLGLQLSLWCFNKVWENFVNGMLDLRLAWVHKVYHKTKVFFKKVTFSNKLSLNSLFNFHVLHTGSLTCLIGSVSIRWVNFVNIMLGLRLAWLQRVYNKTKIFQNKIK